MTAQEPLWTEPEWTDAFTPGDRVRCHYMDHTATVVAVEPGVRVRVRFEDHPYHGTYECSYGMGGLTKETA